LTASDRADMSFQYAEKGATDVKELKAQLVYRQALQEITNEINSADNLDSILIDLKDRILLLFRADRITIYVIDTNSKELFSRFKVGTELSEIRIPISASSIAGYTALTGTVLNISDAYESPEVQAIHPDLKFDKSSNSGHSLRFWELTLPHIILGATLQPITQVRIREINGEE